MADRHYAQVKNQTSSAPSGSVDIGSATSKIGNIYMAGSLNIGNVVASESTLTVPKIANLVYTGSALAANPAGSETITVNGSGFASGVSVYIGNVVVGATTLVSSSQLTFTSPAKTANTYTLDVVNTDGGSAGYVPGIVYSALPVWSTAAGSLGTNNAGSAVNVSLSASENAQNITYTVTSGTLPPGLTLSSSGVLSGTLGSVSNSTTYNFTVTATDPQNQTASQNFSYTVNKVFMSATGGTVTTDGNYKVHTFTTSGTFTVTQIGDGIIQYLAVAGGGSGGTLYSGFNGDGGGGGAGGLLAGTTTILQQAYTITVGGGASAAASNGVKGNNGTNTTCFGLTLVGGGGGGGTGAAGVQNALSGGSGGGGGSEPGGTGGAGTSGQGNSGGNGNTSTYGGGGGGGAGGAGQAASSSVGPGDGGIGISSSITGTSVKYGGGGGGAVRNSNYPGNYHSNAPSGGYTYGGGVGYANPTYYSSGPTSGTANTGGGGGGGGNPSGAGGSGIVIVRYQFQ